MQFQPNTEAVSRENSILKKAERDQPIDQEEALAILSGEIDLEKAIEAAEIPRTGHFGRLVQVHVINNIKNGNCQEDCGYCAQRKNSEESSIIRYYTKSETEIFAEARAAYESGAHRYCLVTSGRGPSEGFIRRYAAIVRELKQTFPMEICLSAGIVTNPEDAAILAEAGLDRYNHNLNTSSAFYRSICTTHDYQDRVQTLQNMSAAGISLCSGVIAGMGESDRDLVEASAELKKYGAKSIPINFYLPVPGAVVEGGNSLSAERCLRILCMFRLTHPTAEIRIAAGREHYLGKRQRTALRVANSLFVSGYLNVKGSDASETLAMITAFGYSVDRRYSELHELMVDPSDADEEMVASTIQLKTERDLRPFKG